MYPNTMLAKLTSEKWCSDINAEIFVERNGKRFQYVLDYLRDGEVTLPITETKEMIICELKYFGVEFDEDKIDEKDMNKSLCMKTLSTFLDDLKDQAIRKSFESKCITLVVGIIKLYFRKGACSLTNRGFLIRLDDFSDEEKTNISELRKSHTDRVIIEGANTYLQNVGFIIAQDWKLHTCNVKNKEQNQMVTSTKQINSKKRRRHL